MKESDLRARYRRIVFFFARVTAGFIWWEIVLRRLGFGALVARTRADRGRRTAVRFRALAVSMGGLMIKVGQFLSARLDVLPPEITQELSGLQDEVPAEDFDAVRAVAASELALPLGEHYAWFDQTPLAAASLGQVHRARLRDADAAEQGFSDVVVKVQRPHIQQVIEVDLSALRRVAGWMERYRPIRQRADVRALVEEFAATTLLEVDYLAEAGHAERFAANFADDPRVSVPAVVWELSGRRVLTLEDVSAIKLGDHDAITAAGISRAEVAQVLADTYLQQIFTDGFFHADPHPGNLFVTPGHRTSASLPGHVGSGPVPGEVGFGPVPGEVGFGPVPGRVGTGRVTPLPYPAAQAGEDGLAGSPDWTLTFIDFGMVGTVPEDLRAGLRDLLIAAGLRDGARMVAGLKRLDVLLPTADLAQIEAATVQVFDRFGGLRMDELQQIDHAEMMRFGLQFRELLLDLPFQVPENLLLLGRSIGILSGICTGLDPEFDIWATITPYATAMLDDERESLPQTVVTEALTLGRLALGLPRRADRVLTLAERGELAVATPTLTAQVRRLERSVSRTNGVLMFAALLVAGAVLAATDPALSRTLMGASVLPLLWVLVGGLRRAP